MGHKGVVDSIFVVTHSFSPLQGGAQYYLGSSSKLKGVCLCDVHCRLAQQYCIDAASVLEPWLTDERQEKEGDKDTSGVTECDAVLEHLLRDVKSKVGDCSGKATPSLTCFKNI